MFKKELKKLVRIGTVQLCTLDKNMIYFKKADSGYWQQYAPYENRLVFACDSDKPMILYANNFLESEALTIIVKRVGMGRYVIE